MRLLMQHMAWPGWGGLQCASSSSGLRASRCDPCSAGTAVSEAAMRSRSVAPTHRASELYQRFVPLCPLLTCRRDAPPPPPKTHTHTPPPPCRAPVLSGWLRGSPQPRPHPSPLLLLDSSTTVETRRTRLSIRCAMCGAPPITLIGSTQHHTVWWGGMRSIGLFLPSSPAPSPAPAP